MSSLRGEPGSAWSLPGSVDALTAAARQAGRPSSVWLAGIAYQMVVLGWFSGAVAAGPLLRESFMEWGYEALSEGPIRLRWLPGLQDLFLSLQEGLLGLVVVVPLALALLRLAAGLACIAPHPAWQRASGERRGPRLRSAWRQGAGLTWPSLALWAQFLLMMFAATLIFVGPAQLLVRFVHLDDLGALTAILSGILVGLLLVYSFLLSILFQLALHSLVQNRRGVGSALLHSWRIAKSDPMATLRAALADAVLYFTVLVIEVALSLVLLLLPLPEVVLWLPFFALVGFAGCARCAFWARAYQTLGGMSTLETDPGS